MKFEKVSIERVASKLNKDKLNLTYELFLKTSKDILIETDDISEKNDKEIFYTTSLNINDDENNTEEEDRYIPEEVFRKQYIPHSFHNPVYRTNNNAENIINTLTNQTNTPTSINTSSSPEHVTLAASLSSQNLTNTLSTPNIREAINQSTNQSEETSTTQASMSRHNSQTIYRSSSATLLLQPINSEENSPTSPSSSEQNSLNSYQSKPFNKNSTQQDESLKYGSNCSLESSCSASTSSNHDDDALLTEENNKADDTTSNSNINNNKEGVKEDIDNEKYHDTKTIDPENTTASSTFLNNIQQLKNDAKNKYTRVPKKDWNKKYSYFDADFTMRAMDKLYSAKFYEYVKDEKNKKCIARHLIPLIKEYKICNLVNGLLWLTYGWSIQSISKLFKYIFRDWSPDLTALVLKHFIEEWPNFKNAGDKNNNITGNTDLTTTSTNTTSNLNNNEESNQMETTTNDATTNQNNVDDDTSEKSKEDDIKNDLANFWNKSNIYILLASIIVEESVLCSSLFIKCFTIDWTRSSVTELIKYLDIVLEWNEDIFKEFTKEFINFLKQDLAIVTAKATKLNGLTPTIPVNSPDKSNNDKMDFTSNNEKDISSSTTSSSSSSQYEYFDSVTITSPPPNQETSMHTENDLSNTTDMMIIDQEEDHEVSQSHEEAEPEAINEEVEDSSRTIKASYSNDFESCSSNSYASSSVSSIDSDYREYQGDDIIYSEDEEIIRIDDDQEEEDDNKTEVNMRGEEEDIQENIPCYDIDNEEDHMLRDDEEEIIEEEVEVGYNRVDDDGASSSSKNKGKDEIEEDYIDEEIPEEIVVEEDENDGKEEEQVETEEEDVNAQLRLEYEKKLREKEETINKIKENKKKSQELLTKLVKLYKANLTLTHYKILLADYQLNAAAMQLNEIKKRISNSEKNDQDEGTSSSSPSTSSLTPTQSSSTTNFNNNSLPEDSNVMNIDDTENIHEDKITSTLTTDNIPESISNNTDPMSMDISTPSTTTTSNIPIRVPIPPSTGTASMSPSFHHFRYMQRLNPDNNSNSNDDK